MKQKINSIILKKGMQLWKKYVIQYFWYYQYLNLILNGQKIMYWYDILFSFFRDSQEYNSKHLWFLLNKLNKLKLKVY